MVRVVFSRPKIGCLLILHLTPSVTSNRSAGELAWCSIRPPRSACITSIFLAERTPTFFNLHCAPMVFSGQGVVPSRLFTPPRFDQRGPNQRGKVKVNRAPQNLVCRRPVNLVLGE